MLAPDSALVAPLERHVRRKCPHEDGILHYATERGVANARVVYVYAFGWELQGDGRDDSGQPLVLAIADELGIGRGCGGTNYKQIAPEMF